MELWFVFSLLTAFFYGLQSVYIKGFLSEVEQLVVVWTLFLFGLPVVGGYLYADGFPPIDPDFWPAFVVSIVVNLVAWPLFVRSVQLSDVSLVMPLLAFTPVCILLVEFLILGNFPSTSGIMGILLVVSGTYLLNVEGNLDALHKPITSLFQDRGAIMMLIVAAIWSISATVEKITVSSSSPSFYLTVFFGTFSVLFIPVLLYFSGRKAFYTVRTSWISLGGAGILTGLMATVQMLAIERTDLVNFVISIKRSGMLISVVLGWYLFQEKKFGFRLFGTGVMLAGIVCIRIST